MALDDVVIEFTDDPTHVLAAAGPLLGADPVLTTVVATVTSRAAADDAAGVPVTADRPRWWALVRSGARGEVVGVAMRTAPFAPYPLYALPMPDEAAVAIARALDERGEVVSGINGSLPSARVIAEETARLVGGTGEVHEHMRLFELGEPVEPRGAPGRLRPATQRDLGLTTAWYGAFADDAAEQAGRPRGTASNEQFDEEDVARRIAEGCVWLWEDERGQVVHVTGHNPPTFGVVRIGPVYTPPEQRGRGFASVAVAAVSRRILAEGHRACLFTDQANPTSNKIYEAIGYRPVVDMANFVVTTPALA